MLFFPSREQQLQKLQLLEALGQDRQEACQSRYEYFQLVFYLGFY
jgi:hypothetical protein